MNLSENIEKTKLKKNKFRLIFLIVIALIILSVFLAYKKINNENRISSEEDITVLDKKEAEFILGESLYGSFGVVHLLGDKIPLKFDINKVEKENKEEFDISLRKRIIELLNMPLPKIPVSAANSENLFYELQEEKEYEKYTEKRIMMLTSNITFAIVYLMIPKNVEFPAPGIMAMHQHGDEKFGIKEIAGKIGDPTLSYAKDLAERGYVVLAVEADSFGYRRENENNSKEIKERVDAQGLILRGTSPFAVIVQEDWVGLEVLMSLDIVDKNNIGCIGHSFGGIRCLYLSALDKRIKSTVISGAVGKLRKNPKSGITQTWLSIFPGIAEEVGTKEILGLIAPRYLLVLAGEKDPIYPPFEAEENLRAVKGLYERLEKENNLVPVFMPEYSHEFPEKYQEEIVYPFLDLTLKNKGNININNK